MQLRPYQTEAIDAIYHYLRTQNGNPCCVLPTGCHELNHPILMADGSVKSIQHITVGEEVLGPDSKPRKVLQLCRGRDSMFIIKSNRCPAFRVNGDHIMSLWVVGRKKFTTMSVRDYMSFPPSFRADDYFRLHSMVREGNVFRLEDTKWKFRIYEGKEDNYYGFVLSGDHLYVDAFGVVHHNSGKTPVLASICKDAVQKWSGRVLILAHVKELLEQAKSKLSVFCPDIPIGLYSAGLGEKTSDGPIIAAGIQSVYRKAQELGKFDLIIVDECFAGKTMISTPTGDIPIEELRVGQHVFNATGIGRIECISAKATRNLLKVRLSNGTSITCTPSHRFFTENGWLEAGQLERGSYLFRREDLRMLRQNVLSLDKTKYTGHNHFVSSREAVESSKILFDILFKDQGKRNERSGKCKEDVNNVKTHETQTETKGREWPIDVTSNEGTDIFWHSLGNGTYCRNDKRTEDGRITKTLQDRYSESFIEDCDRTGREQSFDSKPTLSGYEEDPSFGSVRVESITNIEQNGDTIVYNLQVGGSPTYYAGGVLVHNCHLLPEEGDGMYRQFLAEMKVINPSIRLIGLTATPYRMTSGWLCGPENLLNEVCYEVGVKELIAQGYLCPLITKGSRRKQDYSNLHVRAGEFVSSEVETLVNTESNVHATCREIVEQTQDRNKVLIFASSVEHAIHVQKTLSEMTGMECGLITGSTPASERDLLIRRFKGEQIQAKLFNESMPVLKYMANVNVLTTGFDAQEIDCVVMLRPTASPGLYQQMVGRGLRLHPTKQNCLILDFGGNILRHGPIDAIHIKDKRTTGDSEAPAKQCPECQLIIHAAYTICPGCGYTFPVRESSSIENEASQENILSCDETNEYNVEDVYYAVHTKAGADESAPKTMRVDYKTGWSSFRSEWQSVEHEGWARKRFEKWWKERTNAPLPSSAYAAVQIANTGALARPTKITATRKAGEKYEHITDYVLGPIPEEVPVVPDRASDPFTANVCQNCLYFADGWCGATYQSNLTPQSPSCGQFLDKNDIPF